MKRAPREVAFAPAGVGPARRRPTTPPPERVSITWNHAIEKDSLKIKDVEHVLIEKGGQLFRDKWYVEFDAAVVANPAPIFKYERSRGSPYSPIAVPQG